MKAALIPPKGYEATALRSNIHLALPLRDTRANPHYEAYLQEARRRDHYIILDNGCAEGDLVTTATLLRYAEAWRVNEIVAPDVMGDAIETMRLTDEFVTQMCSVRDRRRRFKIMGVLQGGYRTDGKLLEAFDLMGIDVVGIPKVRVQDEGDSNRLGVAQFIESCYPGRFKIHLLGLNNNWPSEMYHLARRFPVSVRSMDSAQPYKMTEVGHYLTIVDGYAQRRSDYFSRFVKVNETMLSDNINTFLDWASG